MLIGFFNESLYLYHMNSLNAIGPNWTLFLDRDGVINHEKSGDYIRNVEEFQLYEGVLDAFRLLANRFQKIIVVTNQRGIGKGLMRAEDVEQIHSVLQQKVNQIGGSIHAFFYAPDLETDAPNRKPNIGMGLQAKKAFPSIDFSKSIMIGNNISDMQFGRNLGMQTIFLHTTNPEQGPHPSIDYFYPTLLDFAKSIF